MPKTSITRYFATKKYSNEINQAAVMNGPKSRESKSRGSVELLVSGRDLADLDVFTKTDPMCVLFVRQFGQWKEHGRTEAIRSTLNPKVRMVTFSVLIGKIRQVMLLVVGVSIGTLRFSLIRSIWREPLAIT